MAPRRKSIFIMQVTEQNCGDVFLWAKVQDVNKQTIIDGGPAYTKWHLIFSDGRSAYVYPSDWLIMHGEHKIEIISDEGKQYMAKRQPDLFMTVSAAVPEYKHG